MTTLISIGFPSITSAIGLAGGMVGVTMFYLMPMMIQLKMSREPWYAWENISTSVFFGALCAMGYASVLVTLVKTV